MASCLAGQFLSVILRDQSLCSARAPLWPSPPMTTCSSLPPKLHCLRCPFQRGQFVFPVDPNALDRCLFLLFFLSHVLSIGDWKGFIVEFPECACAQIQSCWEARKPRVCGAGPGTDVRPALWTPPPASVAEPACRCCVVLPGMTVVALLIAVLAH